MKRTLIVLGVLLATWLAAWALATQWPPQPEPQPAAIALAPALLEHIEIAEPETALSFARTSVNGQPRLLRVQSWDNGRVRGLDLQAAIPGSSDDPVTLFNELGYEVLRALQGPQLEVDAASLLLPFAGTDSQIAAGVNYPAHGDEVAVEEAFLFPKQVTATASRAEVAARDHLLDYEVELGFVLLQPLRRGQRPEFVGLVLASDYTDRAMLTRHVRLTDVSSGEGFTQGKSLPGSMPLGALLVIPRNVDAFSRDLTLELWRNGHKRQHAEPARMTWDLPQLLEQSWAREGRQWTWNGAPVTLPITDGEIPARTLILSGTPDGVIFQPPTPRQLFLGVSEMLFTLRGLQPQQVIEPFLREATVSGRYLQPGEVVTMRAERLGLIVNRITAE